MAIGADLGRPEAHDSVYGYADPVNHPPHYQGKIECIDAIESAMSPPEFWGMCRGNAIKYLYRMGKKGDALEDIKKARWYIDRLIQSMEGNHD